MIMRKRTSLRWPLMAHPLPQMQWSCHYHNTSEAFSWDHQEQILPKPLHLAIHPQTYMHLRRDSPCPVFLGPEQSALVHPHPLPFTAVHSYHQLLSREKCYILLQAERRGKLLMTLSASCIILSCSGLSSLINRRCIYLNQASNLSNHAFTSCLAFVLQLFS